VGGDCTDFVARNSRREIEKECLLQRWPGSDDPASARPTADAR
jgi:hypothetical protein